ncbi:aldehyde reductase II [Pyrenophora seminiperda CCB06]|uniref:Aldehyde reductase II n=1 Tax=Pyrenophora seminiperda CCB06 TaxID=1302712 RepID=A0A3M7MEL8_9PLEO|nr:aldehyde reductase II [Pyrenophora seminiperda CCB06]
MHVLLTGGSGFIASYVLHSLVERGHTAVVTVRSQEKADLIKSNYPTLTKDALDFAIVPELSVPGAFDAAIQSSASSFDAVLHTASPLNLSLIDPQKDVLDPAIIGTTTLLKSVAKFAPTVKRVVILSSFAAMVNEVQGDWPEHTYTTADWNPISNEEALVDVIAAYRGSKTFAERAAWDFMEHEKPSFTLTTLLPPFVYGPVVRYPNTPLAAPNASNRRFLALLQGASFPTAFYAWIDVRDCALGIVKAMEQESAAGERIFLTSSEQFSNQDIVQIISDEFPEYAEKLPPRSEWEVLGYPEGGVYKVDAGRARSLLDKNFVSLSKSVVDTVSSLRALV